MKTDATTANHRRLDGVLAADLNAYNKVGITVDFAVKLSASGSPTLLATSSKVPLLQGSQLTSSHTPSGPNDMYPEVVICQGGTAWTFSTPQTTVSDDSFKMTFAGWHVLSVIGVSLLFAFLWQMIHRNNFSHYSPRRSMILVALSLWPSYGLAALSIFYEEQLTEEYRLVLLSIGGLFPLNVCFGVIAATTKRRLGEKLLLYLCLAVFVPMWAVIPLYRDKETATLFGYKGKATIEVMAWWMPASAALWFPMTIYCSSQDHNAGWIMELFVGLVALPLLVGSAASAPLRVQDGESTASGGQNWLVLIFDGLLGVPLVLFGAILMNSGQFFFLEYRRYWKHVKSAIGAVNPNPNRTVTHCPNAQPQPQGPGLDSTTRGWRSCGYRHTL